MASIPLISMGTGSRRRFTQPAIPYAPMQDDERSRQQAVPQAPTMPRPTDDYYRRANNVTAEYGRANRLMQGNPAQQAAGQTRMLKADFLAAPLMGQNYLQGRQFASDANSRQNAVTGANVRATDAYTGQMVPALANAENAGADLSRSQGDALRITAPANAAAMYGEGAMNQGRAAESQARVPYIAGQMQAEARATDATAGKLSAEADRTTAEGQAIDRDYEGQLRQYQTQAQEYDAQMKAMRQELDQLRRLVAQYQGRQESEFGGTATGTPPAGANVAGAGNPGGAPQGGAKLTPELASQFLQQAGGDKNRAREMARQAGYSF